ncbi:MAG: M23 family metallopeptidase [Bacteriovoracaceae bacterium]|nr:M23 family metallopeptidase [Bacteriovoracaceae bacterium]
MKKIILVNILLLLISSCSHISSGHYVLLQAGDSAASLSKEFGVSKWKIQQANDGAKFVPGTWVFIPLKRGVIEAARSKVNLADAYKYVGHLNFRWPVPAASKISSFYGHRWGTKHNGIDIPARSGAHILSADTGVVVYAGKGMNGFGNIIVIAHQKGFFTVYAHNKKNFVKVNQKVHKGQVIGQVGQTGRSTGPHLHFEVRRNGHPLNPVSFFSRVAGSNVALNQKQ